MCLLFNRLNMIKEEFYNQMKAIIKGEEFDKFKKSLQEPAKRGLVINSLKIKREDFLDDISYPLERLSFNEDCFLFNSEAKMGGNIYHQAGAIYMQEPSAMIPGMLLPLKEGDLVLDACASPGGKTFQIAKRLKGKLISNEFDFERAKVLRANVERLGLTNVMVTNFTPEEISKNYANMFDAILVDAPCSGEGMFRKELKAVSQWSKEYVRECAERQKRILTEYDHSLKTGGYLVYSTCAYSVEENEEVVAFLVDLGYKIIKSEKIIGESVGIKLAGYETSLCKRFYPHKNKGEGQFVAVLQKTAENTQISHKIRDRFKLGASELKLVNKFMQDNLKEEALSFLKDNIIQQGNSFYYAIDKFLLIDPKKTLNCGIKLGMVIKNRFQPDHNLFKAWGELFKNAVELDEEQAYQYLKGNSINIEAKDGWCVIKFKNLSLGGGKMVDNLLKNHYPKGLRLINTKNS